MPSRVRLSIARATSATPARPIAALLTLRRIRSFSTTDVLRARDDGGDDDDTADGQDVNPDRQAREMFNEWLRGPAKNFRKPLYHEMNYISSYDRKTWERRGTDKDRMNTPFPLNPAFRSHPVLGEDVKDEIYRRVMEQGISIRSVSAGLGVSLERVGAVVRLKAIEKQWIEEGKTPATYLAKAIRTMLPVTPLASQGGVQPFHEGLQDMESHSFSHRQAFVPVSESRDFTRADAGKEFGLPPTEEAVPRPDLVEVLKDRASGLSQESRVSLQREREYLILSKRKEEEEKEKSHAEKQGQVVEQGRWAWRLRSATTGSVGFRYGVPHQDRKKGQVKIPTHVQ